MRPLVHISGIGVAHAIGEEAHGAAERAGRLRAVLAALAPEGTSARLFHPIEELAVLAAYEALRRAGVSTPVRGDGIGIALGVEEGIDGIKARYYEGVLKDGPLGASPITFPLTTANTIAARISILLDLRGENLTVCGGSLSGAQALGLAVAALRHGRARAMLAGGTTAVEQEFLEALARIGRSGCGQPGYGACLCLLKSETPDGPMGAMGSVLGYAEGFGPTDVLDAVQGCFEDARILPAAVGSVRAASVHDGPAVIEAVRQAGVQATIARSAMSGLHSASFPLAVAEAVGGPASGEIVLVVGADCLAGAAAALVRGGE